VIIKTALNAHAGNLYRHLTRTDDGNERIRVVEVRGCVAEDLLAGLREMKATAAGTRCEKSLYHVSFAAPLADAERLQSDAVWLHCADRLEQEFGLENHARAVVHHFKDGRWHQHVVWNRIDPETGRAAHLSHERRRAIKVARELERDLELTPVSSQRPEHRKEQRPPMQWEKEAARRTKVDADQVRDRIAASWRHTEDAEQFVAELQRNDLFLARGESRPFVVVDGAGNFYALGARVLPGENARSVAARLDPIAPHLMPLEEAKEYAQVNAQAKRYRRGGKSGEGERAHDLEGRGSQSRRTPAPGRTAEKQPRGSVRSRLREHFTAIRDAELTRHGLKTPTSPPTDEQAALKAARDLENQRQKELRQKRQQEKAQRPPGRGHSRRRDKPEPD
jgi:hypothetical protein